MAIGLTNKITPKNGAFDDIVDAKNVGGDGTSSNAIPADAVASNTASEFVRVNSGNGYLECSGSTSSSFAASSHNHAASDINSGTLAHERGGLEADVSSAAGFPHIESGSTTIIGETGSGNVVRATVGEALDLNEQDIYDQNIVRRFSDSAFAQDPRVVLAVDELSTTSTTAAQVVTSYALNDYGMGGLLIVDLVGVVYDIGRAEQAWRWALSYNQTFGTLTLSTASAQWSLKSGAGSGAASLVKNGTSVEVQVTPVTATETHWVAWAQIFKVQ